MSFPGVTPVPGAVEAGPSTIHTQTAFARKSTDNALGIFIGEDAYADDNNDDDFEDIRFSLDDFLPRSWGNRIPDPEQDSPGIDATDSFEQTETDREYDHQTITAPVSSNADAIACSSSSADDEERDGFVCVTEPSSIEDEDGEDDLVISADELAGKPQRESTQGPGNKSRQNSLDLVLAAFMANEEAAARADPKFVSPSSLAPPIATKPEPAHSRPVSISSTYQLREYLRGFEGEVDADAEAIELGLFPNAVDPELEVGGGLGVQGARKLGLERKRKTRSVLQRMSGWWQGS